MYHTVNNDNAYSILRILERFITRYLYMIFT